MGASEAIVAVLGAGSWGTALAIQLSRHGHRTVLWCRDPEQRDDMRRQRRNRRFFPDIQLPEELRVAESLESAVVGADFVVIVVPSAAFNGVTQRVATYLRPGQGLAWACKGFEPGTGRFLHQAAADCVPPETPMAVVTGPSFAREVVMNLPTAITVAGNDPTFTKRLAVALHAGNFRAYTSDDMAGAELGGAVKNVLAIGTGIADGLGLGDNARAALVTRGLAEMMRLGGALGARPETLMGLPGLGDLVLTCTGDESRNRRLGLAIGRGEDMGAALAEIGQVVEGVMTAAEVVRLAGQYQVSMPISEQVNGILHLGWDPGESVRRLLAREQKAEHDAD
ncbi:MAG: NAD(P)H-dependent glycerol-3-phosphate dehydrogenase [Xanthomonadales bacterium]|nr:NAD(P)H-dependent glycerol-3-phosphate dehydrogenase [Xanthomonadales bacterium]NIN60512.1 NAD(P)H-dependent glycerol-3-phosphate dehydrogenase [Xanthomonadales bacterium]NIN75867.1 NAD(P)H-dependent glycerol-3-phosphate dehydrogenase [Xanthomonadales bacterium]NIO15257.1 NAD(P)H-dependent glycerol-3-phosphate dehydrogenase [Xanthomonadales bacterium]NIP12905.1 NAD(P)H-dependent glycerol-3-phosphate dehydrogenase [Xanthomonadales bacterium]